ncbi:MAG TPA: hypothetical protein VN112_08415, partial [Ensifer sp.]|nr:hypothetical protein [Ensifer sp.]
MTTETFLAHDKNAPEIFVGIVSPVGTGLKSTIEALRKEFELKGYNVYHIKISDQFASIADAF